VVCTLNLGIVAHVDAGKTSLTERLLFAAGVIDEIGSVDNGSTQTDSLALERQRGITIKSAVVSFLLDDVRVNLIDTPGHPDFIAEVERVLGVLDGAILVVSAVEGVQAQTRVLLRALRRLGLPVLIFVNKIDRRGADGDRVLRDIAARLTPASLALGRAADQGTPRASYRPCQPGEPGFAARLTEALAEHDDTLLEAYVSDTAVPGSRLQTALAAQARRGLVYPVLFGSALTGAGVGDLARAVTQLLPAAEPDTRGPASGTVFKIERGPAGEKVAYVRLFSGTLQVRDRLPAGPGRPAKVTALSVFSGGTAREQASLAAGQIGQLRGLDRIQIGDTIGQAPPGQAPRSFAPPTLETVVLPRDPADRGALHQALTQLAEQDPLINFRRDEARRETLVSLYGEVQKEVIQATLASDYGLAVSFSPSTTICVEQPIGSGTAFEVIATPPNPFLATVGLRVDPAPPGAGNSYQLEIEPGALPLAFRKAIEQTVHQTLTQGLYGWPVIDCAVTLTRSGYWPRQSHAHGTFDASMSSTAGDFRHLTPLVLMAALQQARTQVCQPVHRFRLEIPAAALAPVLLAAARLGAVPEAPVAQGGGYVVEGEIPADRVHELQQELPALTSGEGVLESAFERYQPSRTQPPSRSRWDYNPLNREEYLLRVARPGTQAPRS
jgi:ribosomal protection tetracycline resistance protein